MSQAAFRTVKQQAMHNRSGRFHSADPLVSLFHTLLCGLPANTVETIVLDLEAEGMGSRDYDNGWIASYALDLANRLRALQTIRKSDAE